MAAGIVDPEGREVVSKISIPVVEFGGYQLAIRKVDDSVRVKDNDPRGIRPGDIIKELRATQVSSADAYTFLCAALITLANQGVEGLKEFLSTTGIKIRDLNGKELKVDAPSGS